jgi:hypothetical protein
MEFSQHQHQEAIWRRNQIISIPYYCNCLHMSSLQTPIHIESCVGLTLGFSGLKRAWIGNIGLNLPRHNLRMSKNELSNAILPGNHATSASSGDMDVTNPQKASIRPAVSPATCSMMQGRG